MSAMGGSAEPTLRLMLDGAPRALPRRSSLAASLLAAGVRRLRASPRDAAPRGAFCLMGVCQECLVRVDGRLEQSCLVSPREGMDVRLGAGLEPDAADASGSGP